MKAVILAAGRGMRMRHLTLHLPKPMLHAGNQPLLARILDGLSAAGVSEFCIVTGYRADAIESYFGDGHTRGARIVYRRQALPEGTARAAELARGFVGDEPFLLTHGDVLVSPENYGALIASFQQARASGMLSVWKGDDADDGEAVGLDHDHCLTKLVDRGSPNAAGLAWTDAGLYVLSPAVFEFTRKLPRSPLGEYELPQAILGMANAGHAVRAFEIEGFGIDVRDPETLKRAATLVQ